MSLFLVGLSIFLFCLCVGVLYNCARFFRDLKNSEKVSQERTKDIIFLCSRNSLQNEMMAKLEVKIEYLVATNNRLEYDIERYYELYERELKVSEELDGKVISALRYIKDNFNGRFSELRDILEGEPK